MDRPGHVTDTAAQARVDARKQALLEARFYNSRGGECEIEEHCDNSSRPTVTQPPPPILTNPHSVPFPVYSPVCPPSPPAPASCSARPPPPSPLPPRPSLPPTLEDVRQLPPYRPPPEAWARAFEIRAQDPPLAIHPLSERGVSPAAASPS